MRSIKSKKQKGFTLIEIVIAVLLFSTVMIITTVAFTNTIGTRSKVEVIRDTAQTARLGMEEIARNVRMANGGYNSGTGEKLANSIVISGTELDPILTLIRYDLKTKQNVFKIYRYCTDKQSICETFSGQQRITTENIRISNLSFTGVSDSNNITQQPYVNISFTVQPANQSTKVTEQNILNLATTVTSRDYNYYQNLPRP